MVKSINTPNIKAPALRSISTIDASAFGLLPVYSGEPYSVGMSKTNQQHSIYLKIKIKSKITLGVYYVLDSDGDSMKSTSLVAWNLVQRTGLAQDKV